VLEEERGMSWSEGYVTGINYTFGYYQELDPRRAQYALAAAGFAPPPFATACELGFGQGLSLVMHGAAQPGAEFWGNDFNPSQALFAKGLAATYGGDARISDEAFEEFCARTDLPDFDWIGLHGIWSWISDANRARIVDFARRKLKVGGVFYVSYNTLPGWSSMASVRHVLVRHGARLAAAGAPVPARADEAIAFVANMLESNPKVAQTNPIIAQRFEQMKGMDRSYIAHEYLNRDWAPMYFADIENWLEPAKLSFAVSANPMDQIDVVNLTTDQQKLLLGIADPSFRETIRDMLTNQQFRRDYWIRGGRRLSALEQVELLRTQRFVLRRPRAGFDMKINGLLGEATLHAEVYDPVLDLIGDLKVRSLHEIEQALAPKGLGYIQILSAANTLIAQGSLAVAADESEVGKAKKRTDALNAAIMRRTRSANDINYLASPVIGSGVPVNRIGQIALLAMKDGRKTPRDIAQYIWGMLDSQGQKLVKDGKVLETTEDNLAELLTQIETFTKDNLPVLKALQVA
jgi:SAM-dependent methyltransferase